MRFELAHRVRGVWYFDGIYDATDHRLTYWIEAYENAGLEWHIGEVSDPHAKVSA